MRTACFQTDKQGQKSEVRAESWDMIAKKWYYIAVFALVSECNSNILCEDSSRTQFVGLQLTPARGLKHPGFRISLPPHRLQLTPARGLKHQTCLFQDPENPVATHTREGIETNPMLYIVLPPKLQLTPARGLKQPVILRSGNRTELQLTPARGLKLFLIHSSTYLSALQLTPARGLKPLIGCYNCCRATGCNSHPQGD